MFICDLGEAKTYMISPPNSQTLLDDIPFKFQHVSYLRYWFFQQVISLSLKLSFTHAFHLEPFRDSNQIDLFNLGHARWGTIIMLVIKIYKQKKLREKKKKKPQLRISPW